VQNAQTPQPFQPDLSEPEIIALIRSELKRRKEAAESYQAGGRPELAEKELKEAEILQKYLPRRWENIN